MLEFSTEIIKQCFESSDNSQSTHEKGRSLEDLACYLFEQVPGVCISKRNKLNTFKSEEIDVAFWNRPNENGFYFLPNIILVECKNLSNSVGE